MVATNFYMSITDTEVTPRELGPVSHSGSSSTATDLIELRITTTGGTGTGGLTVIQSLRALKVFERALKNGGLTGAPNATGGS